MKNKENRFLYVRFIKKIENQFKIGITTDDRSNSKFFAEKLLLVFENASIPLHKLFVMDEAYFYLSGHVNHQNCRFRATTNWNITHEIPHRNSYITVWMGVASFGITGPYFFKENNKPIRVNTECYINMI